MNNTMFKINGGFVTCSRENAQRLTDYLKTVEAVKTLESFEVGQMPLEALPKDIQDKAKSVLKAFAEVNVYFEYGEFKVCASYGIKSSYGDDHFVCGFYKAENVFTKEQQRQNFIDYL